MRTGGATFALVRVLPLLALAACSSARINAPTCQSDAQCGSEVCVAGSCLSRAAPPPTWTVEVAPKTDSTAAFTEFPSATAPAAAFDLTATSKVTVTGTVTFDPAATPLAAAHVVLKVPALIPGRPDLQYESDLLPPGPKSAATTFTLALPFSCVGRTASLRVLPTSPDDRTHAPATFTLAVAPALAVTYPSKALTVRGSLLSALGDPIAGVVARGFANGDLVSNVVPTGATDYDRGTFTLIVPAPGADASSSPLSVELEPATSDAPQPHYWAKPFVLAASRDLGDIRLPAYGQPNVFKLGFQGQGDDEGTPAVVNAVVRARTLLADDAAGTTDFERSGVTDDTGQVSLSLLPGSTVAKRLYDIAVVPAAGSPHAATCLEGFPVVTGGLPPVTVLARRPVHAGVVVGDDGLPVAGVVIMATRTAVEHPSVCDSYTGTPQAVATTAADGTFSLYLDAGTYTFDLDPTAGAPQPRLTETGVVVSSTDVKTMRTIQLPRGAVVEGTLRDEAARPLPLAGVRFYRPACVAPTTCPGAPPILAAQARTDPTGHFRAVIPLAP